MHNLMDISPVESHWACMRGRLGDNGPVTCCSICTGAFLRVWVEMQGCMCMIDI